MRAQRGQCTCPEGSASRRPDGHYHCHSCGKIAPISPPPERKKTIDDSYRVEVTIKPPGWFGFVSGYAHVYEGHVCLFCVIRSATSKERLLKKLDKEIRRRLNKESESTHIYHIEKD